ncbi:MAG TPA: hypothetical protein VIL85_29020 [Thermomicrobiales bacterium]|jgi:hypothetical protein
MTDNETTAITDLAVAEQLWIGGRPLEAGRALTALIPNGARPRWAGQIVAWAYRRARRQPEAEVVALVTALADGATREEAIRHRDAIAAILERVQQSGRFDSLHEALVTLALNASRLLVAAPSPESTDPKEGWWFVASLKCVGDELDDGFAVEAWERLRQLT